MTKNTVIRDLRDAIRASSDKKTKGYFAMLGNLAGEVLTAIPNMVYVTTFEGQTKTVINRRVPNDLGSVVFVGSDDYSANKIEVLYSLNLTGSTNDGSTLTGSNVAPHSHGYDSVNPSWIQSAQFLPLLTLPYSGLTVQVYPGVIRTSAGGLKWFAGAIVDLTSYYPASGALWATIQIEDAGTTTVEVGATAAARASLTEADIPDETTGKRIVAIILDAGFDELFRNNVRNDFLDLRFFALEGGGVGAFLDLTDTPSSYSGQSGKAVIVNSAEDSLEFANIIRLSVDNISNPPTEQELIDALGSPDTGKVNTLYHIDDGGAGLREYLVIADGTHWFFNTLARSLPGSISVNIDSTTTLVTGSVGGLDWHGRAYIRRRSDGVLVMVYRSATGHNTADAVLHIRFSDDDGATWTADDTTLGGVAVTNFPMNPPVGNISAGEGVPRIMPNGRIIVQMWSVTGAWPGTMNGTYQSYSDDGGETWSVPSAVSVSGNPEADSGTFITDDDFVYDGVVYAGARTVNRTTVQGKTILVKSTDNGDTWEYVSIINTYADDNGSQEVGLEYLGNNTIIAMLRDCAHTNFYQSFSTDMGATWETPVDVTSTVGLAGRQRVYTRSHLNGSPNWWMDGVLIMVGFVHQTPGSSQSRRNAVWVSLDKGTTWSGPYYVDSTVTDAGYGDIFYNLTTGQFVVVNYYGTLSAASLKQYNLTITGI